MKPVIYLRHGVWACRSVVAGAFSDRWIFGHGHSPFESYVDWLMQIRCMEKYPGRFG